MSWDTSKNFGNSANAKKQFAKGVFGQSSTAPATVDELEATDDPAEEAMEGDLHSATLEPADNGFSLKVTRGAKKSIGGDNPIPEMQHKTQSFHTVHGTANEALAQMGKHMGKPKTSGKGGHNG